MSIGRQAIEIYVSPGSEPNPWVSVWARKWQCANRGGGGVPSSGCRCRASVWASGSVKRTP